MNDNIEIIECRTNEDFEIAKALTHDYIVWLDMDLSFQDINKEYEIFEKMYSRPDGCFIYAKYNGKVAGGVACRKFDAEICEMKRLFVYENMQSLGIGKKLCLQILSTAKELGYQKMRLDTVAKLTKAISLYEKLGFYYIKQYRKNPDQTASFMEKVL